MKRGHRIGLVIITILALLVVWRGWAYRMVMCYNAIGSRPTYTIHAADLEAYVDANDPPGKATIHKLILKGLQLTSSQLTFTTQHCQSDPNTLIASRKANCIGYAAFFTTVCNELLERHQLSHDWEARAYRGQLSFLGVNVHRWFSSPFLQDHDFVIVKNTRSGQFFAVDPSLYDYTGIQLVRYLK